MKNLIISKNWNAHTTRVSKNPIAATTKLNQKNKDFFAFLLRYVLPLFLFISSLSVSSQTTPIDGDLIDGNLKVSGTIMGGTSEDKRENIRMSLLKNDIPKDYQIYMSIGKAKEDGNQGEIGFHYMDDNSDQNALTFGFYGQDANKKIKLKKSGELHIGGYVGIGTTTPYKALHVESDDQVGVLVSSTSASKTTALAIRDGSKDKDKSFRLSTKDNLFRIQLGDKDGNYVNHGYDIAEFSPNGKLGIGTAGGPNAALHVVDRDGLGEGLMLQRSANNRGTGISFRNAGSHKEWNLYQTEVSNSDFRIRGGSSDNLYELNDYFTIKNSGNVGIGTTNPSKALHIESHDQVGVLISSTSVNDVATLAIRAEGKDKSFRLSTMIDMLRIQSGDKDGNFVDRGYNIAEFTPHGKLGLGTRSGPSAALHVVDRDGLGEGLMLQRSADNRGTGISFRNAGSQKEWNLYQTEVSNSDFRIRGGSSDNLYELNDYFTITNLGNVGIGTTTPSRALHIESHGQQVGVLVSSPGNNAVLALRDQTNTKTMRIVANNTNGFAIQTGDVTGDFSTSGEDVGIIATFKRNGNVGIGTNSPIAKLDVKGSMKAHELTVNYGGDGDLAQVSINTDVKVKGTALTVGGAVHIGPKDGDLHEFEYDDLLQEYLLWVEKGIVSEDYAIASPKDWSDNVFSDDYKLSTLEEVEKYIKKYRHLPGIASEEELTKNGYTVHSMNKNFMQKIEELVLYTIAQEKKIKEQEDQYEQLKLEIENIKAQLNK